MTKIVFTLFLAIHFFSTSIGQEENGLRYELSECEEENILVKKPELVSSSFYRDSLHLIISGKANCDGISNMEIAKRGDTLHFTFDEGHSVVTYKKDTSYTYEIKDSLGSIDTLSVNMEIYEEKEEYHVMALCDCCYTFYFTVSGTDPKMRYVFLLNGEVVMQKN